MRLTSFQWRSASGQVFIENGLWIAIITVGLVAVLGVLSGAIQDKFGEIVNYIKQVKVGG